MRIKSYNTKLEEAFAKDSVLRVIHKTCHILSRRIGKKICVTDLPVEVIKQDGRKIAGIFCSFMGGGAIRFNWKLTDKSCEIVSMDYWTEIKKYPDYELVTEGQNIIQIIDAITEFLISPRVGNIMTEDSVVKPQVFSKDISDSINAWSQDMSVSDKDLETRRISELYNQYVYWIKETGLASNVKQVSPVTFRNFIMAYLSKYGIKNIFMRQVKTIEGGKEKIIISDKAEEKKFDEDLYRMTLADKIDFAKQSVRMVVAGLQNSLIFGGTAGIGKTRLVSEALKETSGKKIVNIKGGIKTPEDLYKVFFNNNSPSTILVFDDADAIFGKDMLDLMKAAMDPDKNRVVSFYSKNINDDRIKKGTSDLDIALAKQQGYDIKKTNKKTYTPSIIFESKIIIITNKDKAKINSALLSRGIFISMVFGKNEIIDDIRKNLADVFPEYSDILTDQMKIDTLDFIEQYVTSINLIDYRLFKTILMYRAMLPESPNWKKWALVALRTS